MPPYKQSSGCPVLCGLLGKTWQRLSWQRRWHSGGQLLEEPVIEQEETL